jgi:hypothetical protein
LRYKKMEEKPVEAKTLGIGYGNREVEGRPAPEG